MKSLCAALAALAMMGLSGAALADEASGRVMSFDANTLTLEDGTAFSIAEGVMIDSLQPGEEVTVSYEEQDGQKIATEVQPAQ